MRVSEKDLYSRTPQSKGSTMLTWVATGLGKSPQMHEKKAPMFFQFMLPGSSEKLPLPRNFLKHLMGEKCDKAILKSPLGKSWHVKVCGGKEGMCFGDGWFDFFRGHDLQLGECLVFRYDGDMAFYVTVFGTSACEKKLTVVEKEDIDHRNQRAVVDEKLLSLALEKDKTNGKQKETVCKNHGTGVKRFLSYKAKNPHFATTIVPSNISHAYLNIPSEFRKVVDMSGMQKMTITDPRGRQWPVRLTHRKRGDAHFSTGWTEFRAFNGLQVGDVCLFELSNTKKNCMDAHITRQLDIEND